MRHSNNFPATPHNHVSVQTVNYAPVPRQTQRPFRSKPRATVHLVPKGALPRPNLLAELKQRINDLAPDPSTVAPTLSVP